MKRSSRASPPRRRVAINVTVPLDLDGFLQELGNETRRLGGYHLAKTVIVRSMARALRKLKSSGRLDLREVFTEDEFTGRILRACRADRR